MCPGILSLPLALPPGTILLFALCSWGKFKILVIAEWSVSALTLCRLESQVLPQPLGPCVGLGLPQETIPTHSFTCSQTHPCIRLWSCRGPQSSPSARGRFQGRSKQNPSKSLFEST